MKLPTTTTKKKPEETIAEIQSMLVAYNITGMMTEYDGREVKSVSFRINMNGQDIGFRMPCNWRGVFEILKNDKDCPKRFKTEDQAAKVAWRIIFIWIKAQLAMVEVNIVTIPQVFLPYAIMKDGQTLSEHVTANPQFLLK